MKKLRICFFAFCLFSSYPVIYSQGLSAGILNGISFSDIHGNDISGKWKYKSGGSASLFVEYSFNRIIGIQSGINISTIYYEHQPYMNNPLSDIFYPLYASSAYVMPVYYRTTEKMDFTLLSIPLIGRLTIPSSPSLNLSAGACYSFVTDYSLNYYSEPVIRRDFGYLFSAGLSYPLNDDIDALFDIRYMSGRRRFLDNNGYKHGSFDFRLGIAFNDILNRKSEKNHSSKTDSISRRMTVGYRGGVNISDNHFNESEDSYSYCVGYSAGFQTDIMLSEKTYFRTGLFFERKGYSLSDSSDSYHRYHEGLEPLYKVNTRIKTDYILIPAQLVLRLGNNENFFFAVGPYMALKLNSRCTGEAYLVRRDQGFYYYDRIIVYDDLGALIRNDDFGWLLGGGVTLPFFEKYSLELEIQYQKGISDIFNESVYMNMTQAERGETVIRNRIFVFKAGVNLPVFR